MLSEANAKDDLDGCLARSGRVDIWPDLPDHCSDFCFI
jgi:hypothetical protein